MSKDNLGLPLEYQQMPEYFDAHNVSEETSQKNAVIADLLKKQNVKTVLDMTCGTGSQVFYLHERGFDVTGSDFSPKLLEQARAKAAAQNLDIKFIDGDMRNLQVGKFDAVITMFNAIGHLSKDDFKVTLSNINQNLKNDGIYIFDIFNLSAITDDLVEKFDMENKKQVGSDLLHHKQYSTIDRDAGILTSYDDYTITRANNKPERLQNQFSLQIYKAEELRKMLLEAGFEVIGQYDIYGKEFVESESVNILTVARKNK